MTLWNVATYHGSITGVDKGIRKHDLQLEYYQPTVKRPTRDNRQVSCSPLLFDYLFLRMLDDNTDLWKLPKVIPIRWVIFDDAIAVISDVEIERVRQCAKDLSTEAALNVNSKHFGKTNAGKTVLINGGSFGGSYCKVLGPGSTDTIWVELPLFGGIPTRCNVRMDHVRRI